MDLSYGKQYEEFRAEVRAFLKQSWPPKGAADRAEGARQFRELAIARGYLYRNIPNVVLRGPG